MQYEGTNTAKPRLSGLHLALGAAAGAGLVAAFASYLIPVAWLEANLTAFGVSEIIPAAAPPLGDTARLLIALFCAAFAAAVVFTFIPKNYIAPKRTEDMATVLPKFIPDTPKVSLLDRLRSLRHGRGGNDNGAVRDLSDLPKIRTADAHPDAPARRPIFANRDLGTPLPPVFAPPPVASPAVKPEPVIDYGDEPVFAASSVEAPMVPETAGTEDWGAEIDAAVEESTVPAATFAQAPPVAPPIYAAPPASEPVTAQPIPAPRDLSDLTLEQLVDRLEASLAKLQAGHFVPAPVAVVAAPKIEPQPAPEPELVLEKVAPPVAAAIPPNPVLHASREQEAEIAANTKAQEMDDALKAALATLQRMTQRR